MNWHLDLHDGFFSRLFLGITMLTALFLAGCGGSATPIANSSLTGTSATGTANPIATTAGTTTSTLPPNIFTATPGTDVAPVASAYNTSAITPLQSQCLGYDNSLFNLGGSYGNITPMSTTGTTATSSTASNASCYTGNSLTQTNAYNFNLNSLSVSDQCLQQALAMAPQSNDPTVVAQATIYAEIGILRCARYQVQQAAQTAQWNPAQSQSFLNNDAALYQFLMQVGQSYQNF